MKAISATESQGIEGAEFKIVQMYVSFAGDDPKNPMAIFIVGVSYDR